MHRLRVPRRLALLPLLLAALSLPLAAAADPWKDESGKGRKHFESKDRDRDKNRDKGREKAFEEARKHAGKRWEKRREHEEKQRERAERHRAPDRLVARRAMPAAPRATVGALRRTDTTHSAPVRTAPRPSPSTAATGSRAAAPRYSDSSSSTDARRRAAVSGYISRHPGG